MQIVYSFMKENKFPSSTHRRPLWLRYLSTLWLIVRRKPACIVVSAWTSSKIYHQYIYWLLSVRMDILPKLEVPFANRNARSLSNRDAKYISWLYNCPSEYYRISMKRGTLTWLQKNIPQVILCRDNPAEDTAVRRHPSYVFDYRKLDRHKPSIPRSIERYTTVSGVLVVFANWVCLKAFYSCRSNKLVP